MISQQTCTQGLCVAKACKKMNRIPVWLLISFFLFISTKSSVDEEVKWSLINFLGNLTNSDGQPDLGWNSTTNPCQWKGVSCDAQEASVRKLVLDSFNLSGNLEAVASLCNVKSVAATLNVLSLDGNYIAGEMPVEIANCKLLTHLFLGSNQFSGSLPDSLAMLTNLKRIDISNNNFSGKLPNLARVSGLKMFLAHFNQLTGEIPQFNFSDLDQFNVSFNNLSGRIPDVRGHFIASSFLGNSQLCGAPLPRKCNSSSEHISSAGK